MICRTNKRNFSTDERSSRKFGTIARFIHNAKMYEDGAGLNLRCLNVPLTDRIWDFCAPNVVSLNLVHDSEGCACQASKWMSHCCEFSTGRAKRILFCSNSN